MLLKPLRLVVTLLRELSLHDGFVDDVLAELELVDAVDEVVFGQVVTLAVARALDALGPELGVIHYLFHAEELVLAQYDQLDRFHGF